MKRFSLFTALYFGCSTLFAQQADWSKLGGPWGSSPISATVTNSGSIYLWHYHGFARSLDEGKHWEHITLPGTNTKSEVGNFVVSPDGTIFASRDKNLYKLPISEQVWQKVALPIKADVFTINAQGYIFVMEAFGDILVSTDNGVTFKVFVKKGQISGFPQYMYFFGNDLNFLVAANSEPGYLWRISDDGKTVKTDNIPGSVSGAKIVQHPSGRLFLYSPFGKVYQSISGSNNWGGVNIYNNRTPDYMFCAPSGVLYAYVANTWFESTDEGEIWSKSSLALGAVAFVRYAPNGKFSVSGSANCYGAYALGLSRDNWVSKELFDSNFVSPNVSAILKDGGGRLYAKTCDVYFVSQDDGSHWKPFLLNDTIPVYTATFVKSGYGFARSKNGIWYKSYDKGKTWISQKDFPEGIGIAPSIIEAPNGTLYAAGSFIYKSTNFGETWVITGRPTAHYSADQFFIHYNGDLYLNELGAFYVSSDEGKTWRPLFQSNTNNLIFNNLHISSQGTLLVMATDRSSGNVQNLLYISQDNGISFQQTALPLGESDLAYLTSNEVGNIFALGAKSVYVSKDNCKTWMEIGKNLSVQDKFPLTLHCDVQNYLYVGFGGHPIYKSQQPLASPNYVRGRIFLDENGNCTFDPGENPQPFQVLEAVGSADYSRTSTFDGTYALDLPNGQYALSVVPSSPLWTPCPPLNVSFLTGQSDSARLDLGLQAAAQCPHLRVDISTPLLRRCASTTHYVHCVNEGNAPALGATVVLTLDSLLQYESANAPLQSSQGHEFTFYIGDLSPRAKYTFQVQAKLSCDAVLGQQHCVSAQILPRVNCPIPLPTRDFSAHCRPNTGSYDPNDKQAFANGRPLTNAVPPDTDLEYLIRFQNTGTDTAFKVVVTDQLSAQLNLNSVRPGVSSHPYYFELSKDRTLRFVFDPIVLPDSNTNELASHGFVKFKVSPLHGLTLGTPINNAADIYFDYNTPVRTNTVALKVQLPTATKAPISAIHCWISPNPTSGEAILHLDGTQGCTTVQVSIVNALGQVVRKLHTTYAKAIPLDCSDLSQGMYRAVVGCGGATQYVNFVVVE